MDSKEFVSEVSTVIADNLKIDGGPVKVSKLANRIYVIADGVEFVLVAHTTQPERRWTK